MGVGEIDTADQPVGYHKTTSDQQMAYPSIRAEYEAGHRVGDVAQIVTGPDREICPHAYGQATDVGHA